MDIKLIGQPLFIAKIHPGLGPKARDHPHYGAAQALILLMSVKHRIRGAQHRKQQREEQLFIAVRSLRNASFPVAHDFLRGEIFPSRLRPVALNVGKLRRIAQMMLDQTVLQKQL